ncbi:MAG: hypothetical protein K9W43_03125 [Candidatus Thorarchaeota archaeon]|nr:hypothetical protein [Candidatus Thorarchaeota archaeon]
MQLVENAELIAKHVKLLDREADVQLVREMMELHEDKCRHCQEDRLSCTVRPSCKNRNFLNMLIEVGVPPSSLPSFCYEQYLIQIRRYILERKGRNMINRRVPTKDLLASLHMSSIRQFTTNFTKRWKRHALIREANSLIVAGDDIFFHFDFSQGIVEINPWNLELREFDVFGLYVRLLSKYYNVKADIFDATTNWWVLTIDPGNIDLEKANKIVESRFAREFEALHLVAKDNSTVIQAEIVVESGEDAIHVNALRKLFSRVVEARGN